MPEFNITIKPSFKNLALAFSKSNIQGFLVKEVNRLAARVERYGKQLTPVDSGRLRASIGFVPAKFYPSATIKTGVHYAIYVHEGTRKMMGRPFLSQGATFATIGQEAEVGGRLDKEYIKMFKSLK